jgi:hypothetical protein
LPSGSMIANKKINDDNTCQMSNVPKKLVMIVCFCNYAAKLRKKSEILK